MPRRNRPTAAQNPHIPGPGKKKMPGHPVGDGKLNFNPGPQPSSGTLQAQSYSITSNTPLPDWMSDPSLLPKRPPCKP